VISFAGGVFGIQQDAAMFVATMTIIKTNARVYSTAHMMMPPVIVIALPAMKVIMRRNACSR
jgi:hypothetical protein